MNCRLCLNKCKNSIPIFADNDEKSFFKLIFKHLYLTIQPDDHYSTNLCQNCIKKLQDFHNFFQCVQKCQFSLQSTQQVSAETSKPESVQWPTSILKKRPTLENSKTCRLCMEECGDTISILTRTRLQWINKYLFVKIETGNVHSISMCKKCTKSIQDFHNFFQCVQDCQLSLKNMAASENETTIDSNKKQFGLILKKETEEEFLEKDDYKLCQVFKENAALEQIDEDQSFSDISIKTELLSTEEESEEETECEKFQAEDSNVAADIKSRTCDVCSKVLPTVSGLKKHMRLKHNGKKDGVEQSTCRFCSKVFASSQKMSSHVQQIHNPRNKNIANRTCALCSKVFSTVNSLAHHMRHQHNVKEEAIKHRTCRICSKVYDSIRNMREHMYRRHNPKNKDIANRTCDICAKVFTTNYSTKLHIRLQHDKKNEDVANRTCTICFKVCTTIYNMKCHIREKHRKKQHGVELRTCRICSKRFNTIKKMRTHVRLQHDKNNEDIAIRTCSVCSKVFDKKNQLKCHISKEHKDSEEMIKTPKKPHAKTVKNENKLSETNCEMRHTKETQWPADLQVKEEEPLEIVDFLEE